MARIGKVQPKGPSWTAEQTLRALRRQLETLQPLKGRRRAEAEKEGTIWKQLTEAAITNGFGEGSPNLSHYFSARSAGVHNMMGVSEYQRQLNYDERIEKFEATLLSSIAELEFSIPEAEVRGAYDAGNEYAFYKDLKDIMAEARTGIFIVDNYLNTEFFELYVSIVKAGVTLRIMTDQVRGTLGTVAQKFSNSHTLELRSSPDVHDRHIFVDQRGWIVGQSIKDAARKKPTYLVELSSGLLPTVYSIYESLWKSAAVVVKS